MSSLFELHMHTSEVSSCGHVPAVESVRAMRDLGYKGCVITDHIHPHLVDKKLGIRFTDDPSVRKPERWLELLAFYRTGYDLAAEEGARLGMTVLFGSEIRLQENANDYLLFGDVWKLLSENPYIVYSDLKTLYTLAKQYGILVVQAHPFRPGMIAMPTEHLDGIEIYNGNPRHQHHNCNGKAYLYAQNRGLIETVGSDFHQWEDLGTAGMLFEDEINSPEELVSALRSGKYQKVISIH